MSFNKLVSVIGCIVYAIPTILLAQPAENTVKLSPQIRVANLTTLSMSAAMQNLIKPFLKKTLIIDTPELSDYPYVLAFPNQRITAIQGDKLYARGAVLSTMPYYTLIRPGKVYTDPVTQEILGYAANYIATTEVQQIGDPSILRVLDFAEPVNIGDRLLPGQPMTIDLSFAPHPATAKLSGMIIGLLNSGFTQGGKYSAVVLNRGRQDGVTPGDILTIYKSSTRVKDVIQNNEKPVTLPKEPMGELMVFKVYDKLSFALITAASSNIQVRDLVGNI